MMSDPTSILILAALLLALIGVYRLIRAWQMREIEVLSRDQKLLSSTSLGLSGRPDRLIRLRNGAIIPKEKKSSMGSRWLARQGPKPCRVGATRW